MTQEQIDKECDALQQKYYIITDSWFLATQCAILHQTGIVELLENMFVYTQFPEIHKDKITEAKQILETLKSRVK